MDKTSKKSFEQLLEFVGLHRNQNKLLREIDDVTRKIRDNKKRVLLLENLTQYIRSNPSMSIDEVLTIIGTMRDDYENRIDDYIIRTAEMSKQRRENANKIKSFNK